MSVQAIDRIQPLWTDLQTEGMRLDAGAEVGGTRRTQPTLFSDIFQSAIEVAYQLATGQLDNPAALMTSITEAQASLELLIQLRNKAVESYNELMRLSV